MRYIHLILPMLLFFSVSTNARNTEKKSKKISIKIVIGTDMTRIILYTHDKVSRMETKEREFKKIIKKIVKEFNIKVKELKNMDIDVDIIPFPSIGVVKRKAGSIKTFFHQKSYFKVGVNVKIFYESDKAKVKITGKDFNKNLEFKPYTIEKIIKLVEKDTGLKESEMDVSGEKKLESGDFIHAGDRIQTGEEAKAVIDLEDDVNVVLARNTEIEIYNTFSNGSSGERKIRLNKGKVVIRTGKKSTEFEVKTPMSEIKIRKGTVIGLMVGETGTTKCGILNYGKVKIQTTKDKISLGGREWLEIYNPWDRLEAKENIPEPNLSEFIRLNEFMKEDIKVELKPQSEEINAEIPANFSVNILDKNDNIKSSAGGKVFLNADSDEVNFSADKGISWDIHSIDIKGGKGSFVAKIKWAEEVNISAVYRDTVGVIKVKTVLPRKKKLSLKMKDPEGKDTELQLDLFRR